MKEEVLFLTHKNHKIVKKAFNKLYKQSGKRSVIALCHSVNLKLDKGLEFYFNDSVLDTLNYPKIGNSITPGHVHFPLFYYCRKKEPKSDYFWFVEYDVGFSGVWSTLFDAFNNDPADFLTAHIRSYSEEPKWSWWELNHSDRKIDLEDRWRSFNPIFRISKRAIQFLDRQFLSGWTGHNEVIMITLLKQNGYSVKDFNEHAQLHGRKHNFYTSDCSLKGEMLSGTHRYKNPMIEVGYRKNKIFHPVKIDMGMNRQKWFIKNILLSMKSYFKRKVIV